jgi:hypothetical protein
MKFGYTIVYVSDVAASLAFFEKAWGRTAAYARFPDGTRVDLSSPMG